MGSEVVTDFEPGEQRDSYWVICPHCGAKGAGWDYDLPTSRSAEYECDECSQPYLLEAVVSVDYVTQPKRRT